MIQTVVVEGGPDTGIGGLTEETKGRTVTEGQ